jgi:hypothetical protein
MMHIPLKTVLLPASTSIFNYLFHHKIDRYRGVCCDIYNDKVAVQHKMIGNTHCIRMWKTKALFNYWYDDMFSGNSQFLAALDYIVEPDYVKIDYMNFNDEEYRHLFPQDHPGFTEKQAAIMNTDLLNYVKRIARHEGKTKVIVDVHSNLRIFNKYYYKEGFKATTRRCRDNPYWVEAECIL